MLEISAMLLKKLCWLVMLVLHLVCWTTSTTVPQGVLVEVESNLLSLLGLKRKPRVDRSKIKIPEAIMKMYEQQLQQPYDTTAIPRPGLFSKGANVVRPFMHIESPKDKQYPDHKFRLKFDISEIPVNEKITAAELVLTREPIPQDPSDPSSLRQQILVYDIVKPGIKGERKPITRLIDSRSVDTSKNSTVRLDVVAAVQRWAKQPSLNYGLFIVVHANDKTRPVRHIRLKRSLESEEKDWSNQRPLLFTYSDDGKHRQRTGVELANMRRKRAPKRSKKRKPESCRRHSMVVEFKEVGWSEWIVAPGGYDAYYCSGECNIPLPHHINTTNHAIIQTMMNSVNPGVPKACCVPTSYSAMSMLYLDDSQKVVLKNYKEMVVTGCGCR